MVMGMKLKAHQLLLRYRIQALPLTKEMESTDVRTDPPFVRISEQRTDLLPKRFLIQGLPKEFIAVDILF